MHTIQIMLIEADSPEEAFNSVNEKLNSGETRGADWSDWNESKHNDPDLNFSGRWSNDVLLTPEQHEQRRDNFDAFDSSTVPNYLRYADDPELADYVIDKYASIRKATMVGLLPILENNFEDKVKNYNPKIDNFDMDSYHLRKLSLMLCGEWNSDSEFYDLTDWTTSLNGFLTRCSKAPENQYLIPVDFHH